MSRHLLLLVVFALAACTQPGPAPLVNSGSYDYTDQLRDAQGYPLPGWSNAIGPNGGGMGPL